MTNAWRKIFLYDELKMKEDKIEIEYDEVLSNITNDHWIDIRRITALLVLT